MGHGIVLPLVFMDDELPVFEEAKVIEFYYVSALLLLLL